MSVNTVALNGIVGFIKEVSNKFVAFQISKAKPGAEEGKWEWSNYQCVLMGENAVKYNASKLTDRAKVVITGELSNNTFEREDGTEVKTVQIVVRTIDLMTGGDDAPAVSKDDLPF